MKAELSVKQQCLSLSGEWDSQQVALKWKQLLTCRVQELDLAKLKRIDSAGIAAIITALKPEPNKRLLIKHCPQQAKLLFKLYELDNLLRFED